MAIVELFSCFLQLNMYSKKKLYFKSVRQKKFAFSWNKKLTLKAPFVCIFNIYSVRVCYTGSGKGRE